MDLLLDLLKDKKTLISSLLQTIEESHGQHEGLLKLAGSLTREQPNVSPENLAKCLATTMKVQAGQAKTIQRLAVIALIGCQSSGFDSDVAQMMNKMGRGQEAIRQMFKNKMEGR